MKKICTFVLNKPKVKEMAQLIVTVEDASLLSDLKRAIKMLRGVLPPYMIPNTALQLTEMPMTKNGKIDRNQLRKIYEESLHARHFKK